MTSFETALLQKSQTAQKIYLYAECWSLANHTCFIVCKFHYWNRKLLSKLNSSFFQCLLFLLSREILSRKKQWAIWHLILLEIRFLNTIFYVENVRVPRLAIIVCVWLWADAHCFVFVCGSNSETFQLFLTVESVRIIECKKQAIVNQRFFFVLFVEVE